MNLNGATSLFTKARNRSRLFYSFLVCVTIFMGLASRRIDYLLPVPLHKNAGDVLWATMAYWLWTILLSRRSTLFVGGVTAVFSLFIECFKLVQAPWLESIRATTLGRLIFGYSFSWSNLLCYLIGIVIAALIDLVLYSTDLKSQTSPKLETL